LRKAPSENEATGEQIVNGRMAQASLLG